MKIEKDAQIGGVPIRRVRDALRALKDQNFAPQALFQRIGTANDKEVDLIQLLLQQELIKESADIAGYYHTTIAGNQLANTRFVKRITRAKAEAIVEEVKARATEINTRSELTHMVRELCVFGSYLSQQASLGDVDIAVDLMPRPGGDHVARSLDRAEQSGKRIGSFVGRLTYGYNEVIGILKGRSPYISLHEADELEKLDCKWATIFSDGAPPQP